MNSPNASTPALLAAKLGLSAETFAARVKSIGLTTAERDLLRSLVPQVERLADSFINLLYERFSNVPELSSHLTSDALIARLKLQQKRYLISVFQAQQDWGYVLERVAIGAAHHRIHLTPPWFLATYSHFVTEHLKHLVLEPPLRSVDLAIALLKVIFLDATIVLDSYGMIEELSVRATSADASGEDQPVSVSVQAQTDPPKLPAMVQMRLTSWSVDKRRQYLELSDEHLELLRPLQRPWQAIMPNLLEQFYNLFTSQTETAALVPPNVVARLQQQVGSYWQEFCLGAFDRPYASSRMRIGVIHERIGLSLQWYLVGVGRHAEGLLNAIVAACPEPLPTIDAFIRGLFFDLTYVIDAYIEAQSRTLLRTEGYASQLITGLSSAVLIVDGDRRVVSVNKALLDLLGVDSTLLYRVPLEQAIPTSELGALLDRIDAGLTPVGRVSTIAKIGHRLCRVTAIKLDPWEGLKGKPTALVFDDISELSRVTQEVNRTDEQLAMLVKSASVTLWEMDLSTWSIDLISSPVLELTGFRDVYFIGKSNAWGECIAPEDRSRFEHTCQSLQSGERTNITYRLNRADGNQIWVRTTLTSRQDKDRRAVLGVSVDVSTERLLELRQQERDLALERERAKSDFLAVISHEIRTPLNGVLGLLDYLIDNTNDTESIPMLRTAHGSATELIRLLSDLLDLSRLDAGRTEIQPEAFDLVAMLEDVADLFRPQAEARSLGFSLHIAPTVPNRCHGDSARIRQIVVNLVSNALKFTRDGSISLSVSFEHPKVTFSVVDSGVGVPTEKRNLLFTPYSQLHSTQGGTGLGLSICRRLARLMNGDVTYRPATPNGSHFELQLPLPRAPSIALPRGEGRAVAVLIGEHLGDNLRQRLRSANWQVLDEFSPQARIVFADSEHWHLTPAGASRVLCADQRPLSRDVMWTLGLHALNEKKLAEILTKVGATPSGGTRLMGDALIADDNQVNQLVLKLLLQKMGLTVDAVATGHGAVVAARDKRYQVIFLDLWMPDLTGPEATKLIHSQGANAQTPIIALTASTSDQDKKRCLDAGMEVVLLKPIQLNLLREVLERLIDPATPVHPTN